MKRRTTWRRAFRRSTRPSQIKADYVEALVYKGLLLRLQANLEKDPAKQQALIKEADQLRDKAQELGRRRLPVSVISQLSLE